MNVYRALINGILESETSESFEKFEELKNLLDEKLRRYVARQFYSQGEYFREELLQKTWSQVWLKACQCRENKQNSIYNWIKTIALHIGFNMMRDSRKLDEMIALDGFQSEYEAERFLTRQ